MPTTEICTLNLKPGTNIKDTSGATAKALKECNESTFSQKGLQKLWFGTGSESPNQLQLFLNWNSKADHDNFQAADSYKDFREQLSTLHSGSPDVVHVDFQPEHGLVEALSAPVTEVATFYYDKGPPATAFSGAKTLLEALKQDGVNVIGWAFGTTHEVIVTEGAKGRGTMLIVGWESLEAHEASHNTQALKDNIHLLTTPEVKTFKMHHVQATAFSEK